MGKSISLPKTMKEVINFAPGAALLGTVPFLWLPGGLRGLTCSRRPKPRPGGGQKRTVLVGAVEPNGERSSNRKVRTYLLCQIRGNLIAKCKLNKSLQNLGALA